MINPAFGLGNNLSFSALGYYPWCGQIGKYFYLHILQQLDHTDYRRVDCDLFVEEHQFKGGLVWLHLHSVPPGREERACVQVTRSSAVTR